MKQNSHESPLNSVSLQKLLSLLEINRGTADQSERGTVEDENFAESTCLRPEIMPTKRNGSFANFTE